MNRVGSALLLAFFLAGLLCFPALSIAGASAGLLLWFQKVLPVLLPFLLASRLMAKSRLAELLPPRACAIFLGFLCGYPMGAVWTGELVQSRRISRKEGQRMLVLCNQPSPMFLTGYMGVQCLGLRQGLPLLLCAFLPSLACALFFLPRPFPPAGSSAALPEGGNLAALPEGGTAGTPPLPEPLTLRQLEACFLESCETLVKIGGYILLFSILASWASLLPLPPLPKALLLGLCEMTNGVSQIGALGLPLKVAAPLCLGLACFGGFSCLGQTAGCLSGSGLRLLPYAAGKLVQSLVSAGLLALYFALAG